MKVYGAVPPDPVNVISGAEVFLHTAVVPLTVAVGNGFTTTTADPLCACEQEELLASRTLIRLYVNVPAEPVDTGTEMLLPESVETVRLLPVLIR
jgi:hypothetical protein